MRGTRGRPPRATTRARRRAHERGDSHRPLVDMRLTLRAGKLPAFKDGHESSCHPPAGGPLSSAPWRPVRSFVSRHCVSVLCRRIQLAALVAEKSLRAVTPANAFSSSSTRAACTDVVYAFETSAGLISRASAMRGGQGLRMLP